ncbi:SDR family oxidoreductase [Streptomyces sp. NPDC014986]|uniref:SDR family oxidoreductase n=1 Tax=Streptomyces sp. NPDC014986 TaxID=3364934 RepID=UPI0036F966BA
MNSAEPRVALVTGCNRGAGRSIAAALRERGCRVFGLNRTLADEDWLTEIPCDLSVPEEIPPAVDRVLQEAGRVDICVSNAVDRALEPIATMSAGEWERMLSVNLTSSFHLTQALLPAIRASRGQFVFMGSHAGTRYFEGGAAYSATKAALAAFTETLLLEERANGVRACLVAPGAIANLEGDDSPYKMTVDSVARCVASIIDLPADMAVGQIEIRPASPLRAPVTGIDRLLYV